MDNDLISRAKAKEMLRNRLGWLMLFDLDLALEVLDKVPTVNTETEEVKE